MMNISKYAFDTREGKLVSFDLVPRVSTVHVIQAGDEFTVMDKDNSCFYTVEADTAEKAVKAYIDWCFGKVNLWVPDPDEFGCYEQTTQEVWASECCDIYEQLEDWDVVVES